MSRTTREINRITTTIISKMCIRDRARAECRWERTAVCTLPVFRPVIGFDKQEIVDISQKIGTFETSIEPFEDCCTIFVAKHPVTKPNLDLIKKSETKLEEKIDEMLKQAVETAEIIRC